MAEIVAAVANERPRRRCPKTKHTSVREIIVTGPNAPTIGRVEDLGGVEVAVRDGSGEVGSRLALNDRLARRRQRQIVIRTLPPALEDEDLLEMANVGLLRAAVVNDLIGDFWTRVLPNLSLHSNIVMRDGVAIAWAVRRGSPSVTHSPREVVG